MNMELKDLVATAISVAALLVALGTFALVQRREVARDTADMRVSFIESGRVRVENHGPRDAYAVGIMIATRRALAPPVNLVEIPAGDFKDVEVTQQLQGFPYSLFLTWKQGGARVRLKEYRYDPGHPLRGSDGYPQMLNAMMPGRKPIQILKVMRRKARWNRVQRFFY
ncbi:hypothetical protein [Paenarthrobacter ilicis]|uniref:hypothetical protein n=1 Tax=Paenarthrobacter ilicis TaxID=43665 RepID=UPI00386F6007